VKLQEHSPQKMSVGVHDDLIVINVRTARIEMTKEEAVRLAQLLAMAVV